MTITWSETDNAIGDTEEITLQKLLQFKISGASHGGTGRIAMEGGGGAIALEGGTGDIKLE